MEVSRHEAEIQIPIPIPNIPINITTTTAHYGDGNNGHGHEDHHHQNHNLLLHHNHNGSSSAIAATATATATPAGEGGGVLQVEDHVPHNINNNNKKHHQKKVQEVVKYRECLKNHAASMGGTALDGCGEFMPNGQEGTLEALTCSACNCHRNFHRKEPSSPLSSNHLTNPNNNHNQFMINMIHHHHPKFLLPPPPNHPHPPNPPPQQQQPPLVGYPTTAGHNILPSRMILPYNVGSMSSQEDQEEEDIDEDGSKNMSNYIIHNNRPAADYYNINKEIIRDHHLHHHKKKKRFRTKFTQEQKEKMMGFAERVGWKIQKQEESVVQQFCEEIGVKRRVLKVWMHNNKHNFAKKIISTNPSMIINNNPPSNAATDHTSANVNVNAAVTATTTTTTSIAANHAVN